MKTEKLNVSKEKALRPLTEEEFLVVAGGQKKVTTIVFTDDEVEPITVARPK